MLSRSRRGTAIADAFPMITFAMIAPLPPLSGFTGVIAGFSRCQRNALLGLLEEMLNDWDHPLLFRKQDEVAGGRDHRKLGVGDALGGLNGVLKAYKIGISEKDENRRFD